MLSMQKPFSTVQRSMQFFGYVVILLVLSVTTLATSPRLTVDEQLLEAEHILSRLGYWVLKVDGIADASTRHALTAFQKVEHRKRTGILDEAVLEALRFASRPAPRFNTGRTHIEIDITGKCFL